MSESVKTLLIPAAIVVSAVVIAVAIYLSGAAAVPSAGNRMAEAPREQAAVPDRIENANVTRATERRIYGNPDAPITIVEFSDLECPFCARLHTTLKQLVDGSNGGVNWEYRHFPLSFHQTARPAAIASECVAKQAGQTAYWQYLDVIFANIGRATNDFLKAEAGKLGVASAAFESCISDPATAALVDTDIELLTSRFGPQGTPFSLVVNNQINTAWVVSGAQPLAAWNQVLATARGE